MPRKYQTHCRVCQAPRDPKCDLALCRTCYNAYATAKADQARREAGVPKRGKATVCRTPACGKPRDMNCELALCSDCYRARERNNRRAQRGTMPHQFRFGVERPEKPERNAAVKPVAVKPVKGPALRVAKPTIRRVPVPNVPVVIGPEAIERVEPVDVRGHEVTRIPAVHGWGR